MTHLAKAFLALAAPLTLAATPSVPACAQTGVAYNDMYRNATVNGAFQANAMACQNLCKATLFCAYFTYYNNTGGCWLQGNQVSTFASEKAVSGPVACPGEEGTSAFLNSVKNDAAKAKDAVVGTPAPQAKVTDVKLGASLESGSSESGGFPWWGWAAGGVGAALVGGGAAAYFSSGSDSKKKKKTRAAKTSPADVEGAEAASEALVNSSSLPPLYPVANTATSLTAYGNNPQQQPYYPTQAAYPSQSAAPGYAYYYQQ